MATQPGWPESCVLTSQRNQPAATLRFTATGPAGSTCSQEPAGVSMVCRHQLAVLPAFPLQPRAHPWAFQRLVAASCAPPPSPRGPVQSAAPYQWSAGGEGRGCWPPFGWRELTAQGLGREGPGFARGTEGCGAQQGHGNTRPFPLCLLCPLVKRELEVGEGPTQPHLPSHPPHQAHPQERFCLCWVPLTPAMGLLTWAPGHPCTLGQLPPHQAPQGPSKQLLRSTSP